MSPVYGHTGRGLMVSLVHFFFLDQAQANCALPFSSLTQCVALTLILAQKLDRAQAKCALRLFTILMCSSHASIGTAFFILGPSLG